MTFAFFYADLSRTVGSLFNTEKMSVIFSNVIYYSKKLEKDAWKIRWRRTKGKMGLNEITKIVVKIFVILYGYYTII